MPLARTWLLLAPLALGTLAACADRSPTEARSPIKRSGYVAPAEPANGELIRVSGTAPVYLAFGRTLYGIPDMQTLRACTGGWEKVIRDVAGLPAWPTQALPSAGEPTRRPHGRAWMFGDRPVKTESSGTVWTVVGCVRSGVPDPATYQGLFGDQNFGRVVTVASADLLRLPEGPVAAPVPLRRAGTLLNDGWVKWVTYHGGSLGVPDPATMDSYCRPWSDLVNSATEHAAYAQQGIRQPASPGCLRGNDYPYAGGAMNNVDPWNFYSRQCTSFAAWRLNQEGVEFHNYFGGPHWGNASNWDNAALALNLPVNKTPKRGAIAQWNSNHVAYVAAVHNDGTVTIEEYNQGFDGRYSSRRIPASAVENYIHFR